MERLEIIHSQEPSKWQEFEGKTVTLTGRPFLFWPIDQYQSSGWSDNISVIAYPTNIVGINQYHIPVDTHPGLPDRYQDFVRIECESDDGSVLWFHELDILAMNQN